MRPEQTYLTLHVLPGGVLYHSNSAHIYVEGASLCTLTFSIAPRVRPVPFPGAGDDIPQLRDLGFPAQLMPDTFGRSHQPGWVSRPAGGLNRRDSMASHLSGGLNHLFYRITNPIAQVEHQPVVLTQRIQSQQVCGDQVADVDIIPDAGAVRRRVVRTEDMNSLPLPQGYLQHQWYQVRFRLVGFAALGQCARSVEVAQRSVA